MKLTFLGQGFEETSDNAVGKHLIMYLTSKDFHSFTAFSAFNSLSAIKGLYKPIDEAKKSFKTIKLILGINQRGTSKETLDLVYSLGVDSNIFYHGSRYIFHPKIYMFEGDKICKILIGSSNLTSNGLFTNIESSILVTINAGIPSDQAFVKQIKDYYGGIFNSNDPNLKSVTPELIKKLLDDGIIPTEKEKRAEFSLNSSKGKKAKESKDFPTRRGPKIPEYFTEIASVNEETEIAKASVEQSGKMKYRYNEQSYHFPQGVHIGHILYALKILHTKKISGSYLDDKYIRLRGNFDPQLGGFQRKTKYLLIGLMEMEIINDNRNSSNPAIYFPKLTTKGSKLAKILDPLLDSSNLKFKRKSEVISSWEMIVNKKHYVSLVKALINSSTENLVFWRDLIQKIPAINIMLTLLNSASDREISKSNFIYQNFFSFKLTIEFCKSQKISPGTVEDARHRCPFLLDLLEIGNLIEQENSYVVLTREIL